MRLARFVFATGIFAAPFPLLAAPCAGFTDVEDISPFCVNVEWMKNRGITLGVTATLYDPNSPVTRLQMAAFMYRLGYQNAFLQGGNAFGGPAVLGTTDDQPLHLRVNDVSVLRIEALNSNHPSLVAGHTGNVIGATVHGAVVAGGGGPGGCSINGVNVPCRNEVAANFGTISGGLGNLAAGNGASVGGGLANRAIEFGATVIGGYTNLAEGDYATVAGGSANWASGDRTIVLGGADNVASGMNAIAAGRGARADQSACTVLNHWSSGESASCNGWPYSFHLYGENGLSVDYNTRLEGGFGSRWVHIGKQVANRTIATWTGAYLSDTGQWQSVSDVNRKIEFAEVDKLALLERVAALPIGSWRYRAEPEGLRHIGPTAQDFNAAFGLGEGVTTIGSVDADGIALAAIQALNTKLEAEVAALRAELSELRSVRAEVAAMRAATAERSSVAAR